MSTEVITFACKHCDRKLKVKAALAGKQVKCPGCSQPLRIPTPKRQAGQSPKKVAAAPSTPKPVEQDEFGLGSLGGGEDDLFGGAASKPASPKQNPLANHVVADPGFAHTDHMISETPKGAEADDGFARNPLLVQMEREQEAARQQQETLQSLSTTKKKESLFKSPAIFIAVVLGLPPFFGFLVGLTFDERIGAIIASIGFILGVGPFSLGVHIWGLILVAKTAENKGLHIALFLIIPFYNLIYTFQNWESMKNYFYALLAVGLTSSASMTVLMIGAAIDAASQTRV